jgi:hypothetical protein
MSIGRGISMKTLSSAALTAILATATLTAHASGVDKGDLEQCKSQVSEYYGGAREMQYVGQRRFRDGTQMKFAVHTEDATTGYTTTRVATCWLGAENLQANSDRGDGPMVADVYDAITDSIKDPLAR